MANSSAPSESELRAFVLGTLPANRVELVRAWLDSDPAHLEYLERLTQPDPLTVGIVPTPNDAIPPDSVERIVRGVSDAVKQMPANTDDTPSPNADGGTVQQSRTPVDVPAPVWPPQRLGEYRVVREIGRGGMGVVLEVADDTLNRRVAAKVLTPELAKRPDSTARFLREARAAAAIEHENVVPILHVGVESGAPYIVMPLLKGEALDKRLKREGALPVAEVVRIGREIAAGLGAAHSKGLVHRDMKPANVWLDAETDRARVLDFGLARHGDGTDALTEAGMIQGTPAYMSPEQIDALPTDARTDLFALGAILYECTTGKRGFPGGTITAILKSVATHNPTPPATVNPLVSEELSALIMRLLAKNSAERPASASEVGAALAGMLAAPVNTSSTPTVTYSENLPKPVPRASRRLWLAGGGLLAVLLVVGIVIATRSRPPEEAAKEQPTPKQDPPGQPKKDDPTLPPPKKDTPPAPVRYKGKIDVTLARTKADPLVRLNAQGALPMRLDDTFRIDGEVDPPAYVYVVWIDPGRDVTPVYPWNPTKGWGSRPPKEEPVPKVSLPTQADIRYRVLEPKAGVTTMVLFARATPLDVPDDVVKGWFESLPDLPLPQGGDRAAVWFDNFVEVNDPNRPRTFGEVGSDDAFAQWQGKLQKAMGKVDFQTAVSFARTSNK